MLLRHLGFLTALAREKHFARAAAACDVSQPTLSAAIRQLEEELGTSIVERGNRFRGLTREGEAVLAFAQRTLADHETLRERLADVAGTVVGRLRIGIVPSAAPIMPTLLEPFMRAFPNVHVIELSMTSNDILRGLADFELDCAVSYAAGCPETLRVLPLYDEGYLLVTPRGGRFDGAASATWREAADLPLCLQDRSMQNRHILDAAFLRAGLPVQPQLETNSIFAACSHVRGGYWSSVIPGRFAELVESEATVVLPLVDPVIAQPVGLITVVREQESPVVRRFRTVVESQRDSLGL